MVLVRCVDPKSITTNRQYPARPSVTDTILGYASFVNVLDYTNVVVPVTKASSKIDVFDHDYKPLSELDKNNLEAYKSTLLFKMPQGTFFVI